MASSTARVARVAVCGLGRMGQIRARALQSHPRFNLVAVCDQDFELAHNHGAELDCKPFGHMSDALVTMGGDIDAFVVCTPTFSHLQLIRLAAAQSKAVMTEKPVCEGVEDIELAFAATREANVPLFCSFQRRFDPSYVKGKEAVAGGAVGIPQLINVAFRDHPVPPIEFLVTGGDPFTDLMPHDIDFVRNMLGEDPCEVYSMGSSFHDELKAVNIIDTAMSMLKFPSGAICKIDASRSSVYGYDQRVEIYGSEGSVEVGNPHEDTVVRSTREGINTSVLPYSFPQRFAQAYAAELDHFAEVVLDGVDPLVSEKDCIEAQRVSQAALQSFREGVPVKLE